MSVKNPVYQVLDDQDSTTFEHYAALDIGSNSFHLVITRLVEGSLQIVSKVKIKVRLAEGLDENDYLSEEYIQRGIDTLKAMTPTLQGLSHKKVRVVATYTLRRARNARIFLQQAKKVFPYQIEIISGTEEARLIYVGIQNGISENKSKLIFDIGGGSTEFAIGSATEPDLCRSINIGCVSFQKRFFSDGKISHKACLEAIMEARRQLELPSRRLNELAWEKVYASSGTAKAILSVIYPEEAPQPISPLNIDQVQLLLDQCIMKKTHKDLDFPGLSDERKPVFAAGLCITLAIFQSVNIKQVYYSSHALREGVLNELQPRKNNQNICLNTAQSIVKRYHVDTSYAHHVLQSCMQIYNSVKEEWELTNTTLRFVLGWASLLHEVGLHVNTKGIQRHSAYILQHADMPGFNQEQQAIIALLVRFHRKKIRVEEIPEFVNFERLQFYKLLTILRIAMLLNMNRNQPVTLKDATAHDDSCLCLTFHKDILEENALLIADLDTEQKYLSDIGINLFFRNITS